MKKKAIYIAAIFFAFVVGLFVEKNFDTSRVDPILDLKSENVRLSGYKYISPLLECEQSEGLGGPNFSKLESEVSEYIDFEKNSGRVNEAAVYFRQLNNGSWFGINQDMDFAPASLLKVPVMMTYFKASEDNPSILDDEVVFDQELEVMDQKFGAPQEELQQGKVYTNLELIERMIVYSDNYALGLLGQQMDTKAVETLLKDLGVSLVITPDGEDYLSVRSYASFFRILFNASYLDKKNSELALSFLAKSTFDDGIKKGVPDGVEVASKFGQRDVAGLEVKQLHDCGIVYHPKGPYLLCIMTRGEDYNILSEIISAISKMTHESYSK